VRQQHDGVDDAKDGAQQQGDDDGHDELTPRRRQR
jgi:hypothetical protein